MTYAIVESGGKQYKAVAGETMEVDRLPLEIGAKFDFDSVLLVADGDDVTVGTPTVSGIPVKATVVAHFKGPKIIVFKYSPKKRIRVKRGHRQQYTRLMIEQVGKATAVKKAVKEAPAKDETKAEAKKAPAKKAAAKKAPAKKAPAKKAPAKKAPAKKAPAKKAPAKKTTSAKKTASKTSKTKTAAKKSSEKKS